jgi:hypothetical protein
MVGASSAGCGQAGDKPQWGLIDGSTAVTQLCDAVPATRQNAPPGIGAQLLVRDQLFARAELAQAPVDPLLGQLLLHAIL